MRNSLLILSAFLMMMCASLSAQDDRFFSSAASMSIEPEEAHLLSRVSHSFVGYEKSPKQIGLFFSTPCRNKKNLSFSRAKEHPKHYTGASIIGNTHSIYQKLSFATSYAYRLDLSPSLFMSFGASFGGDFMRSKWSDIDGGGSESTKNEGQNDVLWGVSTMLTGRWFYIGVGRSIDVPDAQQYEILGGIHFRWNRRLSEDGYYYEETPKTKTAVDLALSTKTVYDFRDHSINGNIDFMVQFYVLCLGGGYSYGKDRREAIARAGLMIGPAKIIYSYHFLNAAHITPKYGLSLLININPKKKESY